MALPQRQNNFVKIRRKNQGYIINEDIRATEIRIVGDNIVSEVCSLERARQIADDMNLDLVEINAESNPPICKVVDFKKYLYEKKKKDKDNKKSNKTTTKEIKLGPNIGDHDFDFKLKLAIDFLKKGHKVKAYMQFRGREITHKEQGEIVILKFIQALEDCGKPEFLPKMEGKNMYAVIAPKKQ